MSCNRTLLAGVMFLLGLSSTGAYQQRLVMLGDVNSRFAKERADTVQAAPKPVDFTPFADGQNWIVKQSLVYRVGVSKDSVIVPRGFVTDLASIPPVLQSIIQQNGPYLLPAVVHDYLYWKQSCTRKQSDQILRLAMIENEVRPLHRVAIYNAVRAAGQFAWEASARENSRGVLRIIPEDRLDIPAKTKWPEYRAVLMRENLPPIAGLAASAKFCARGSMTEQKALTQP